MVAGTWNPRYSGGWGKRITWAWEVEVAVSQYCTTVLQWGQQKRNFFSKQNKTKTPSQTIQNNSPSVGGCNPNWESPVQSQDEKEKETQVTCEKQVAHSSLTRCHSSLDSFLQPKQWKLHVKDSLKPVHIDLPNNQFIRNSLPLWVSFAFSASI